MPVLVTVPPAERLTPVVAPEMVPVMVLPETPL